VNIGRRRIVGAGQGYLLSIPSPTVFLVVCPITRTERPWRTRVPLVGTTTGGFIVIEQLKSLDFLARGASRIATMLDL
jgi:mRNA-degrading endonuclease toxin of MazEF toxin-antitoxin module